MGQDGGMRAKRAGILGAAIAFAQSDNGKRVIKSVRERLDTPQNREKAKALADSLKEKRRKP